MYDILRNTDASVREVKLSKDGSYQAITIPTPAVVNTIDDAVFLESAKMVRGATKNPEIAFKILLSFP